MSDRARRARKLGAYTETVRRSEIAKRDRWTCYICQKKIDKSLTFPDPMSASLDHVVPLAVGGTHEPANLRITHLRCNVSKGHRPAHRPAQIALDFGRVKPLKIVVRPSPAPPPPRQFTCPVCAEAVTTTNSRRRYCSSDCSRAASAIKTREKYQPKRRRHPRHMYEWAKSEEVC